MAHRAAHDHPELVQAGARLVKLPPGQQDPLTRELSATPLNARSGRSRGSSFLALAWCNGGEEWASLRRSEQALATPISNGPVSYRFSARGPLARPTSKGRVGRQSPPRSRPFADLPAARRVAHRRRAAVGRIASEGSRRGRPGQSPYMQKLDAGWWTAARMPLSPDSMATRLTTGQSNLPSQLVADAREMARSMAWEVFRTSAGHPGYRSGWLPICPCNTRWADRPRSRRQCY